MYRLRSRKSCSLLVAASAAVSLGCGGSSAPPSMLDGGWPLLNMPPVPLALELDRIPLPKPPPFKLVTPAQTTTTNGWRDERSAAAIDAAASTRDADLAEFSEALAARNMTETQRNALVEQYAAVRAALQKHSADAAVWAALYDFEKKEKPRPAVPALSVPQGLPAEFDLYLTGAVAWHEKKPDAATAAWKKLLDLPEKERRYRSTWAAFMIGKTLLAAAPADAVPWFEKTRALAQAGFADRLGLAFDSIGWQAQGELKLKHFQKALELYMLQRAAGADVTVSVRFVCDGILQTGPDEILKAARDPISRRAVTASLLADAPAWRGWGGGVKWPGVAWFDALDKARADTLEDADRLAWIAYEGGDIASAQRWLKRAPEDSAAAAWLRAKLLLRDNKPKEAAPLMAKVVKLLPTDPTLAALGKQGDWGWHYEREGYCERAPAPASQIMADIGVIHLARREFSEALRALSKAGFDEDAAYLAERVLTIDELAKYVDQNHQMGQLLAQRLVRAGREKEAQRYVAGYAVPVLNDYVAALDVGRDPKRTNPERAAALMKAARIAYQHQWDLFWSATEPSRYAAFDKIDPKQTWDARRPAVTLALLEPSEDEQKRLKATASIHEKSSQSPYIAANIAWEAIQLMPGNSDETARALIEAGGWLKARDPKAADRFYKALVRRCGRTPLGIEAEKLRWFPKTTIDP